MDFLRRKKEKSDEPQAEAEPIHIDHRKARAWFDRAKTVADTSNYDYAIDSYLSGLKFDPESMPAHEAILDVARRRKVNGGKPAGLMDKSPISGKGPLEKMLAAEWKWARDLDNAGAALEVMETAASLNLGEVAWWIGDHVINANKASKRPSKQVYAKVRDLYAEIGAYDKAVEACAILVRLDPEDDQLRRELHDLQAEVTLMKGKYGDGDFRDGIKDADKQKQLEAEDAISASADQQKSLIDTLREDFDANPDDNQVFDKLIRALLQNDVKELEDEALKLLAAHHEKTGSYRYKMQADDVQMKQVRRAIRQLKSRFEAEPDNAELRTQYNEALVKQARFELKMYTERAKNYPTDLSLKYQLGLRQLRLQKYDDAVASFQEAQSDPKFRSASLNYLGEAFAAKGWYDEAIDTFRRGIDNHESDTDPIALQLRYDLMDALENKARKERKIGLAEEASSIGSQIAQTNINFKDIRNRLTTVREFLDELRSGDAPT